MLLALAAGAACHSTSRGATPPVVQPGAPGQPAKVLSPARAPTLPRPGFTAADVAFMQGMIGHHAQAVEMTELLEDADQQRRHAEARRCASRSRRQDEIKMMQRWLEARGQEVPGPHAHAHARRAR